VASNKFNPRNRWLPGEKTRRGKCKMYHNVLVGLPGKETETNIFAIKLQR